MTKEKEEIEELTIDYAEIEIGDKFEELHAVSQLRCRAQAKKWYLKGYRRPPQTVLTCKHENGSPIEYLSMGIVTGKEQSIKWCRECGSLNVNNTGWEEPWGIDNFSIPDGKAPKEVCICAAVKTECGDVIKGHRHSDCFAAIRARNKVILKEQGAQGFITSIGRYVDRIEGAKLMKDAGFMRRSGGEFEEGDQLVSEDLY